MLDRGCYEVDRRKRGSCGRVCEGEDRAVGEGEDLKWCGGKGESLRWPGGRRLKSGRFG